MVLISSCTCPGYNITYMCRVCGSQTTATVWEGTAFDCPGVSNEISLRHSQFIGRSGECNNGALEGYSVVIEEQNCYVSKLNARVSAALNGTTVECAFDGDSGQETVDIQRVEISTGMSAWLI